MVMLWTWSALWAAFAFVALAAPTDNYESDAQLLPAVADAPVEFDCTGKNDGAYGVGCSKDYWLCWNGVATEQWCPADLMFNDENKQCDYFANVFECSGQRPTTVASDNAAPILVDFDCTAVEDGDHPFASDCQETYVSCVAGIPYERPCPTDLVFDPVNRICDRLEHIVACGGSLPEGGFDAPSDHGNLEPVDFDCANLHDGNYAYTNGDLCQPKFVACAGGVAWELNCPEGLLFDPDQLLCERPDAILACGGTAKPITLPTTTFAAEPITRPRHYTKTPAAEPSIQRNYKTTPAAEPTTENYYDTYTVAAEPPKQRNSYKSFAAEPTTQQNYYETTTPAAEPTTQSYYETTTPAAEPTTLRNYYTTTFAAEPTTERNYYETSTQHEPSSVCNGKPDGDYPAGICVNVFYSCWKNQLTERTCNDDHVFDPRTRVCEHAKWVESCPEAKTTAASPTTVGLDSIGHDSYANNYNSFINSDSSKSYGSDSGRYNPPSGSDESSAYGSNGGYNPSNSGSDSGSYRPRSDDSSSYGSGSDSGRYNSNTRSEDTSSSYGSDSANTRSRSDDSSSYGSNSGGYNPSQSRSDSSTSYGRDSGSYNPSYTSSDESSNGGYNGYGPSRCRGNEKISLGECKDEFILCKDRKEIRKWCPAGTVFDTKSLNCAQTNYLPECAPASPPSRCSGNVNKVALGECQDEFILCKDGKEIHKWCPSGTVFDTKALNCAPIYSVPGCAPTPPPSRCRGNEKIALGDCNDEFIACMDGVELHKWCPSGTVFDSVSLTCAYRCVLEACSQSEQSAAPTENSYVDRRDNYGYNYRGYRGFDPFVDNSYDGGYVRGNYVNNYGGGFGGFFGGFRNVGFRGYRRGFRGGRRFGLRHRHLHRHHRRGHVGYGRPRFNEGYGGGYGNYDPYALEDTPRDKSYERSRPRSKSSKGSPAWPKDESTSYGSGSDPGSYKSSARSGTASGSGSDSGRYKSSARSEGTSSSGSGSDSVQYKPSARSEGASAYGSDSGSSNTRLDDELSSYGSNSAPSDLDSEWIGSDSTSSKPSHTQSEESSVSDSDSISEKSSEKTSEKTSDEVSDKKVIDDSDHSSSADNIEESDFSCTGKPEGDYAYRKCSSLYAHCAEDGKFKALFCQSPDMSYNEEKKRCVVDPDCTEQQPDELFSYDDFDDDFDWDGTAANETGHGLNGTRSKRSAGFHGHHHDHHRHHHLHSRRRFAIRGGFVRPFNGGYNSGYRGYGSVDPFAYGDYRRPPAYESSTPVYSSSDSGAPVWPSSPPAVNNYYSGREVYGERRYANRRPSNFNSNSYGGGYQRSYPSSDSGAPVWPSSPPAVNSYYPTRGDQVYANRRSSSYGRPTYGGPSYGRPNYDGETNYDSGAPVWPSSPPATNSYYRAKRSANETDAVTGEGVNGTRSKRSAGFHGHHHDHHRRHHLHSRRRFAIRGGFIRPFNGGYNSGYRGYGSVDPFAFGGYRREYPSYERSPSYESTTYAPLDESLCAGKPDKYLHALGVCSREYCICYQNKPYQQQCAEGDVFEPQYSRCVPRANSPTCSPKQEPAEDTSACANDPDGTLHALGVCSREFCICYRGKPYQQQCAEGDVFEPQYNRCVPQANSPTCTPREPTKQAKCAYEPDGTLHALGVCSREYCICYQGKPYQQECAEGDVFMPKCGRCLRAQLVPSCNPDLRNPPVNSYNQDSYAARDTYGSRASTSNQDSSTGRSSYNQDLSNPRANTYGQDSAAGNAYNRALPNDRPSTYNQDSASGNSYKQDSSNDRASTYNQYSSTGRASDGARANTYNQDSGSGNSYNQGSPNDGASYNRDSSTGSDSTSYNRDLSNDGGNTYVQDKSRANIYDPRKPTARVYTYTVPFVRDATTPTTTPYFNPYGRLSAEQSKAVTDERCRDIPEGDTRAIGRCRQDYIECRLGQAIVRFCSDPLVFDSATRVCAARATLPQCSSGKSVASSSGSYGGASYGSSSSYGSVTSLCQARGDGYYRHPTDCQRFVQCFRGNAFVLSCASGLVFNANKDVGVCDYPVNVPECQTAGDAGTVQDAECEGRVDGAFFRDAQDCKIFYRCVHGRRLKFDCPATTVFNERLNVCDWPTAVPECSSSGDAPAPY